MTSVLRPRPRALSACLLLALPALLAGCSRWSQPELSSMGLEDPGRWLAVHSPAPAPAAPRGLTALMALDLIHEAALRGLRAAAFRRGEGRALLIPAGGGARLELDLPEAAGRPVRGMPGMPGMIGHGRARQESADLRWEHAAEARGLERGLERDLEGERGPEAPPAACRELLGRVAEPGDSWWAWSVETGLGYGELARINGRSLASVSSGRLGAGDAVLLPGPGEGPPCAAPSPPSPQEAAPAPPEPPGPSGAKPAPPGADAPA